MPRIHKRHLRSSTRRQVDEARVVESINYLVRIGGKYKSIGAKGYKANAGISKIMVLKF